MQRDASSPDAYVADVDGELREILDAIRALIREVAPDVPERIGHGMLDYPGLCNLGAQKHHVAVYTNMKVVAELQHLLPRASCGKSCIRFRRLAHLDTEALREILKAVLAV